MHVAKTPAPLWTRNPLPTGEGALTEPRAKPAQNSHPTGPKSPKGTQTSHRTADGPNHQTKSPAPTRQPGLWCARSAKESPAVQQAN